MIVTVFRSRLMPGFKDEYVALVERMAELARATPGYISHKGFWAEDGERCASTSNRNFEGRQGRGGRTHLMSPEMAAAAAVTGHLADVREII